MPDPAAPQRRSARLLLVLGPPTSGKSSFIDRLRDPGRPDFARMLGIRNPGSWRVLTATRIAEARDAVEEGLILHYALSVPLRLHLEGGTVDLADRRWPRHRSVLDLCADTDELIVAVIWAEPEALHRRTRERLLRVWFKWERLRNPLRFVERVIKLERRESLYRRHRERLVSFYEMLIAHCERSPAARVFVVDTMGPEPRLLDVASWRAERARLSPSQRGGSAR